MKKDIKQLGKDTLIYGISTILGRFWNFLLVPLYTNIFSQSEYGLITNIYAIIALLNVVFLYGMDSAYMKYSSAEEREKEPLSFNTALIFLFITSLLLSAFFILLKPLTMSLFEIDDFQTSVLYFAFGTLFFDTLCMVPFARLRLKNKALTFALIKTFNIVLSICLNIYFIYYLKYRIEGVFFAGFLASVSTFIILIPFSVKKISFKIDNDLLKSMLKFGIPFVPAGLASIMVQVINRPIMLKLTDAETVGVFQANYKLGIFMMLIVSMFQYAWQPFFMNNSQRPDAKLLFSKIFTYFTLVTTFIFLALSFFIDKFVKLNIGGVYIIGKDFWEGLFIVPIILLGYLFNGFYVNFLAGLQITKQTKYMPIVSGIGAGVTILLNFLLIPPFQMLGAAIAMLVSYMVMAYLMYKFSFKFYPIDYEWKKVVIIGFAAVVSYAFSYFGSLLYSNYEIILKLIALSIFIVILHLLKVLDIKSLMVLINRKRN